MSRVFFCILVITLCAISCTPSTDEISEAELTNTTRSIAIPLVNTEVNVVDIESGSDGGNVTVTADDQGRVSVQYDGEVVSRDWSVISPPLPLAGFAFEDSITAVIINKPDGSPFLADEVINRIDFAQWNIRYVINHDYAEELTFLVTIPQILRDCQPYTQQLTVPYDGVSVTTSYTTDSFNLDGYSFVTSDNEFDLLYDARLPNGERVQLQESAGIFQPFNPSYVEGYLGSDAFDVRGDIVPVDLFSVWKSGGVIFENPSIDLYVENALGLPMSAEFEEFSITTVAGDDIPVQSQAVDDGIELAYPSIAERGEAKITTFSFDKTNSNIKDLFAERVERVNYDITAVYNKDSSLVQDQHIGEGGYFSADVSVVLPLEGNIRELVLSDTIDTDIDFADYDEVLSAEIKSVIANEFPLDLSYQLYFLGDSGTVIDSLYEDGAIIKGADVDATGRALPAEPDVTYITISTDKWDRIKNTAQLMIDFRLNTNTINDSPLWVYDDYDVSIKMGAIIQVNIN